MKKISIFLLTIYLCMLGVVALPVQADGTVTVTILQTTDIHGNFQRDKESGTLGYSGIAAIQRSLPDSILVDCGDYLTSNMFAAEETVDNVLNLMNTVGYHVAGVGEADLANGVGVLRSVQDRAAFHMLSSNVTVGADREPLLGNTHIIEVKGIKLGFFSVLNPEVNLSSSVEAEGVYLEDASKYAQKCVNDLRAQGADVVIALSHMGNQDGTTVDQLAAFVSGIDFIFDGHDHQEEQGRFIGETLILNPGYHGKKLMQLDLTFSANKSLQSFSTTLWSYEATENLPLDDAILHVENEIIQQQNTFLKETVATSRVGIPYSESIGYQADALGQFIADAYRNKSGATVALLDSGSVGYGIPTGDLTKADILAVLPNDHTIQTKRVTPKMLKTALESGVSGIVLREDGTIDPASKTDKFPQISGFHAEINLKNDPGERVVEIRLDNGVRLNLTDDRTAVVLASNNAVLAGQNDYDIFADQPVLEDFGAEGQALLEYLNASVEYSEYQQSRMESTDKQENFTGLIVSIILVILLVVMILLFIIKMMTKVS